jgi:hypothetical protein
MKRSLVALVAALMSTLAIASAASAEVRPGVQTITDGSGQCTGNFIFSDGAKTYLGQSAHCASTGASTDTNGCIAQSLPLGTRVEVEDASNPGSFPVVGTLVYSSWITMKQRGEDVNSETCQYNDFALVELPAGTATNPTVPFWGGPQGIGGTAPQQRVFSYGNSSLRFGIEVLKPKRGVTVTSTPGGWSHTVYTATPGIPGDSGSAFLNAQGQALGTLSTVALAPFPASNGVSDLGKELAYLRANGAGFSGVNLVNGTVAFNGGKLL